MGRPGFAVVAAVAALGAAGCQKTGGYTISWHFATETAPAGCGAHGVDTILVTGASMEGDGESVAAVCADQTLTHGVPVGTWTFMVHQLDVQGREILADQNPTTPATTIGQDQTAIFDSVMLASRPLCSDGVDNDGDGRVDLDDPDCKNDLNGASEEPVPEQPAKL